jgi:hypothetical protein
MGSWIGKGRPKRSNCGRHVDGLHGDEKQSVETKNNFLKKAIDGRSPARQKFEFRL